MEQEMTTESSSQVNSKLLTTAINYHGQELMRALQTEQGDSVLGAVDARAIDYVQYHQQAQQQQEFHLRCKKQKFRQFIAKKADKLFTPFKGELPVVPDCEIANQYVVLPPVEEYMEVPALERRRLFYQTLEKGDYVIGQVKSVSTAGYFVNLLCLDGGKKMFIHDLGIKTVLLSTVYPIKIGDLVRAAVHGYTRNTQKIMLSITNDIKHIPNMRLGVITKEELPSHYRDSNGKAMKFTELLEKCDSFKNPSSVQNLCAYFGISNSEICSSLMKQLCKARFPEEEYATNLRNVQSSGWAAGSVSRGVAYVKEGKNTEAFQCFNNALKIDPINTDALVARGTVFANMKSLRKAIEDFEKALSLEPSNVHAKKHLSDTRLMVGKILAQKGDVDGSLENLNKSVELNPDNEESAELIRALLLLKKAQEEKSASKGKTSPASNSILDTRDKLKILINEEQKFKLKRRRHSSLSSPSQSTSSTSNQETGNTSHDIKRKKSLSKQIDDEHKLKCEQFLESNRRRLAETQAHLKEPKRVKRRSYEDDLEKYEKSEKGRKIYDVPRHGGDRHKKHMHEEELEKYEVIPDKGHRLYEVPKHGVDRYKRHPFKDKYEIKTDRGRRIPEAYRYENEKHSAKLHSESVKRKVDNKMHTSREQPEIDDDHAWVSLKKHTLGVDCNLEEKSEEIEIGIEKEVKKRCEQNTYPDCFPNHLDISDKKDVSFGNKGLVYSNKKEHPDFSEQSKHKVFFVLRNDQDNKSIGKGLLRDNSVAHCFRDDSDEELLSEVQSETSKKLQPLFKKPTLFLPRKYRSNHSGSDDDEDDSVTPVLRSTDIKAGLPLQNKKAKKGLISEHRYRYEQPRHYSNQTTDKHHFDMGRELKSECHLHENTASKKDITKSDFFSSSRSSVLSGSQYEHHSSSHPFRKDSEMEVKANLKFAFPGSSSSFPNTNAKLVSGTKESIFPPVAPTSAMASTLPVVPRRLSAVDVFKHDLMKF